MKSIRTVTWLLCVISALEILSTANAFASDEKPLDYKIDDYRNFFCTWPDTARDALTYAKNMGYRHVSYINGMENYRDSDGLYFVLESPEYFTYKKNIELDKEYSAKQIAEWENSCAMKDASKPFPANMATGWFFALFTVDGEPNFNSTCLLLNFQKQKIIDRTVDIVYKKAEAIIKKNPNFKLGGCIWDVPQPTGDFYGFRDGAKRPGQVKLEVWTGKDSVSVPDGVKLDYNTYSEGLTQYRRQLRAACKKLNPNVKFIMDPWDLYRDYIEHVEKLKLPRGDPSLGDLLMSESPRIEFTTDERIFTSGYIDKEHVATSNDTCFYNFKKDIENIAAAAAIGGWSIWYGMPGFNVKSIRDVPAREKITHAVATWENLNHTPLSQRLWNADRGTYDSPTAHMSADVVWAIQPETNRLFFSFLSPTASVRIPEGQDVEIIYVLDSLFSEYKMPNIIKDLSKAFSIKNGKISINDGYGYICGEGFVARLKKLRIKK